MPVSPLTVFLHTAFTLFVPVSFHCVRIASCSTDCPSKGDRPPASCLISFYFRKMQDLKDQSFWHPFVGQDGWTTVKLQLMMKSFLGIAGALPTTQFVQALFQHAGSGHLRWKSGDCAPLFEVISVTGVVLWPAQVLQDGVAPANLALETLGRR